MQGALSRAVEYARATQDPRGAWSVEPDARCFDTAIVAYAVVNTGEREARIAAARSFRRVREIPVQRHDRFARLLDEGARSIVLAPRATLDLSDPACFEGIHRRKMLLLYVLARHAGFEVRAPWPDTVLIDQIQAWFGRLESAALKPWGKVDLLAMAGLLAPAPDHADAASAVAALQSLQSPDGSFCHNPISTALALLALTRCAPRSEAYRRALAQLLGSQHRDGSWRFCTCDSWDTSLMLRAFAGHPRFEAELVPPALGFLARSQNADGGWGFRTGVDSDNDTSSCVLLALAQRGLSNEALGRRALDSVRSRQRADGLWDTWQSRDDEPVEDCVAHVVSALVAVASGRDVAPARAWLRARYRARGAWHAGWYRNLAYGALEIGHALPAGDPLAAQARRALLQLQNADGGFGLMPGEPSTANATGLAIAALLEVPGADPDAIRRAIEFLVATQTDSGTWQGQAEMFAPRPLVCHYATNTHAFAAMGLMAAARSAQILGGA